ncbi:hypothetical protein PENTCL1PPCAC_29881, partial [Pristionchus entomophagus]
HDQIYEFRLLFAESLSSQSILQTLHQFGVLSDALFRLPPSINQRLSSLLQFRHIRLQSLDTLSSLLFNVLLL